MRHANLSSIVFAALRHAGLVCSIRIVDSAQWSPRADMLTADNHADFW